MQGRVPTYELYGEGMDSKPDFWLHCETLYSRSSLHNFEIALHRHDNFFQFLHVEKGMGHANFDGVLHPFRAPCAISISPGFNHGFAFSRDITGHIVTVLRPQMPFLEGDYGGAMSGWLMQPRLLSMENAPDGDAAFLTLAMRQIQEEYQARKAYKNNMLESLLKTLIVLILRHGLASMQAEEAGRRYRDPRVERLVELIDRHFREHRPVTFYAGLLGLSPAHLNRIARLTGGATVQQMIARKLIDAARRDLVVLSSSVHQIAYGLGFSDPAYFSRFFQRMTGETPRAFRLGERERLAIDEPMRGA
jgi:AraC family transcriptional regulator, transcriptional activator of pobA